MHTHQRGRRRHSDEIQDLLKYICIGFGDHLGMTKAVRAMVWTDPTIANIELVKGIGGRVNVANKRKFAQAVSIAKEEGAFTVCAFVGEETAIKVETNRSDQWAQILLIDWQCASSRKACPEKFRASYMPLR
jgi:hypothetical protein